MMNDIKALLDHMISILIIKNRLNMLLDLA